MSIVNLSLAGFHCDLVHHREDRDGDLGTGSLNSDHAPVSPSSDSEPSSTDFDRHDVPRSRRPGSEPDPHWQPPGAPLGVWTALRLLPLLLLATLALEAVADVSPADRDALVDLYTATNGTGWTLSTNWLSGDPCNATAPWYSIGCSGTTAITYACIVLLCFHRIQTRSEPHT
jgi:hypothetical protein